MRALLLLPLLLLIISCGGGGGGGGEGTGVGTDQQGLVVSASKTEAYEGEDIVFSIEAYDLDGTELSASISCDQGTLSNNTLTLPSTDTESVLKCEASTALSNGRILVQEIALSVLPIELFFNDDISEISELKIVGATYRGPQISKDDITIRLGNTSIKPLLFDSQILFEIPLNSASSSTLAIDTPYENLLSDITISNAVIPSNPADYVADFYSKLESRLLSSSLDQSLREALLLSLDQARSELSTLSAQELDYLSAVMSLNLEPLLTIGTTASASFDLPSANCVAGYLELGIGVGGIGVGAYVAATGAGAVPGLITATLGAVIVYDGFKRVNKSCQQTVESRINQLIDWVSAQSVSAQSVVNEGIVFSEATPKALQVLAKKDLPPEIESDYNEKFGTFSAALMQLKEFIDLNLNLAEISLSNEEPEFEPDNAADYTLSVSLPNVRAEINAGEVFNVALYKINKNLNTPAHLENTLLELELQHNEYPGVSSTQTAEFKPDIENFSVSYSIVESDGTVVQTGRPLEYDQNNDGNIEIGFDSLCDGDLAGSSFMEDYRFDLSSCNSNGDCILTLSSPEEGSFSGRYFNVDRSKVSIDFDEGEPDLADDPVEFNGREYRVFIGGTESINVSVDRNTLAFTGTLIDDDIWTWELDDDELICTYTKTITGTPISCSSSGPANCAIIGN